MKKILLSILTIGLVSVVAAFGITQAFFSDTETSTGNILAAGAIDLLIDNTSYRTNSAGVLVASPETSWNLKDLTIEKFFNFTDLKPGDVGEDTISIHVNNNDAWACARADISDNSENGLTEPEADLDDTTTTGELGNELNFAFWNDDGDNVFESNETIYIQGPASNVLNGGTLALAQPSSAGPALFGNTPLTGASTEYIGKFYCYGTLATAPVPQQTGGTPLTVGTGFTCNGSAVTNVSQSDMLIGDISFYAVQSRNNDGFSCDSVQWPDVEPVGEVGALLSAYDAPKCDVTVNPGNSIQAAIDAAAEGTTICLADGTHNSDTYPLRLNENDLTLAGVNGPLSSATLSGGVVLDNDNTTVTGLIIGSSTLLGETFGVYVNTGVDSAEVSYNMIVGTSTAVGRGIVNATGTTTNAVYMHNVINTWLTGIFLNPSSGMLANYNTVTGNTVGIGNDNPTNNTLTYNVIKNNSLEGVGAFLSGAESLIVSSNNIYDNGTEDDLKSYGATSVFAENNWWGDTDASDNATGPVDFDPEALVAFVEN